MRLEAKLEFVRAGAFCCSEIAKVEVFFDFFNFTHLLVRKGHLGPFSHPFYCLLEPFPVQLDAVHEQPGHPHPPFKKQFQDFLFSFRHWCLSKLFLKAGQTCNLPPPPSHLAHRI